MKFHRSKSMVKLADIIVEFENYEIQKFIGKGSFGTVFLCDDKLNHRNVALKVVEMLLMGQPNSIKNFLREIFVPIKLHLPGIVQTYGFRFPLKYDLYDPDRPSIDIEIGKPKKKVKVDLSGPMIVTEYMPNGSLDHLIIPYIKNKGVGSNLNPTTNSKIIFGVAATLKKLHQLGFIHRDLKVANVFLDENFEAKIADFGLSKQFVGINNTLSIGTPFCMAPEIFMSDSYDQSVDVYAFAFFMYNMFTSALDMGVPIRSPTHYVTMINDGKRPKRQSGIPDVYWNLIQQCWAAHPPDRPTFEQITDMLKDDKYAINEFGQTTDLDALHEYQRRIDIPLPEDYKETIQSIERKDRKTEFTWTRH